MAALALLGLAGFPATGHAIDLTADLTPDTTRYLSDPSFLPLEGQIYSETVYSHTDQHQVLEIIGGPTQARFAASGDHYSQTFDYGISDRFSILGSATYSDTKNTASFQFGPPSSESTHEFENPTFAATYRALEQIESPVSLDVRASYSPATSNNLSQSGQVALFVNRETKFLTIQGEFGATYIDSYTGNQAEDHNGYWNYFAGMRTQMRLTDSFAINSGVIYSQNTDISERGFLTYHDKFDGNWSPYAALVYSVVPNHVDVSFEYDRDFIGDDRRDGVLEFTGNHENLYAIHLRLLF